MSVITVCFSGFCFVFMSSDHVRVTDESQVAETSRYGPCFFVWRWTQLFTNLISFYIKVLWISCVCSGIDVCNPVYVLGQNIYAMVSDSALWEMMKGFATLGM